jgi:hypothetical protein
MFKSCNMRAKINRFSLGKKIFQNLKRIRKL